MVSFTARRSKAVPVVPARPTPHETKALSDLDGHPFHWYYVPWVEFFRRRPSTGDHGHSPEDPAKAVKAALAEALVHYYPMAGRLRVLPDGKLAVDCRAQGVMFTEADADVCLDDFGEPLLPPYPCVEELLSDAVGDTGVIVAKPLVFVQVTRLRCGEFVIGFHLCHCIADGIGMIQFMRAIVDFGRGEAAVTVVQPVWDRGLLTAKLSYRPAAEAPSNKAALRGRPAPAHTGRRIDDPMLLIQPQDMVSRYFIFGPREMAALRSHLPGPADERRASRFKLLATVMWRCRTVALGYQANQRVVLSIPSNARGIAGKHGGLFFPRGYYGNALLNRIVKATVGELCGSSLGHSLDLVHNAKLDMSEEMMRSMVSSLALQSRGAPAPPPVERVYVVSDTTRLGEDKLDFGWAERVGGGTLFQGATSMHLLCKGANGEESVAVSMLLPRTAMQKFEEQMRIWLRNPMLPTSSL